MRGKHKDCLGLHYLFVIIPGGSKRWGHRTWADSETTARPRHWRGVSWWAAAGRAPTSGPRGTWAACRRARGRCRRRAPRWRCWGCRGPRWRSSRSAAGTAAPPCPPGRAASTTRSSCRGVVSYISYSVSTELGAQLFLVICRGWIVSLYGPLYYLFTVILDIYPRTTLG